MPHDKKGRLIEVGDTIKVPKQNGDHSIVVGPVCEIHSESQMCTGRVLYLVPGGTDRDYFNAQDAELILKKNGTEPSAPNPDNKPGG